MKRRPPSAPRRIKRETASTRKGKKGTAATTPIRGALRRESRLLTLIEDGLGALKKAHRNHLSDSVRKDIEDSLDIDDALLEGNEEENRCDYLLGHGPSGELGALEPHSAKQDESSK